VEIPLMNGVHWSESDTVALTQRWVEKTPPAVIAREIGRTEDSVRTAASRLRLTGTKGTNRTYRGAPCELKYREIIAIVGRYYGLGHREMTSKSRIRRISWPRQIAMAMGVEFTNLSLPKLATYFDMDHTTVIHGNRRVPELCRTDTGKLAKVNAIRKIISDACCSRVAERMCESAWAEFDRALML